MGTWASALGGLVAIGGTSTDDGKLALAIALIAIAASAYQLAKPTNLKWISIGTLVCGIALLAIFAIDGRDIFGEQISENNEFFGDVDLLSPGWGLWLLGLGSSALIVSSTLALAKHTEGSGETLFPVQQKFRIAVYGAAVVALLIFFITASGIFPSSNKFADENAADKASASEYIGGENTGKLAPGFNEGFEEDPVQEDGYGDASSNDKLGQETDDPAVSALNKTVSQDETLEFPDQYSIKVKKVSSPSVISANDGLSDPTKPKGKWVVLEVSIRNDTRESIYFYATDTIKLLDTDGTFYTSDGGRGKDQVMSLQNYIDARDLQPKLWETGNLAFDVPKSAAIKSVQVSETLEPTFEEDAPVSFIELD